jgi:hypothetical protein
MNTNYRETGVQRTMINLIDLYIIAAMIGYVGGLEG